MRRELADLIGSGLLLLALGSATIAALAPTTGAGAAPSQAATLATAPQWNAGSCSSLQLNEGPPGGRALAAQVVTLGGHCLVSCPRTTPPGFVAEWMFT